MDRQIWLHGPGNSMFFMILSQEELSFIIIGWIHFSLIIKKLERA